jgi:hypothetical protein
VRTLTIEECSSGSDEDWILVGRRLTGGAAALTDVFFLGGTLRGREEGPAAARGSLEDEVEMGIFFAVEIERARAAKEEEGLKGGVAIFRASAGAGIEGGVRGSEELAGRLEEEGVVREVEVKEEAEVCRGLVLDEEVC